MAGNVSPFSQGPFSFDPNLSPNNQNFASAVRAVMAAGGYPVPGTSGGGGGTATLGPSNFANPTNKVSGTATNGTSTFAMRADAAPALDEGLYPVWAGIHVFTPTALNSAAVQILNTAGTSTQFNLIIQAGNTSGKSSGLQILAGGTSPNVADVILSAQAIPGGTAHYINLLGNGAGQMGWNGSTNVFNWTPAGQFNINGQFLVNNTLAAQTYFNVLVPSGPGVQMSPNASSLQVFVVSTRDAACAIGTSTVYLWGTGTRYPVLQFAGLGALASINGTSLSQMCGGLYYNGTNFIYGQAGTGVLTTLGTGSFIVQIAGTSGTANGTAAMTTVFSIGGTVTSNTIQGYGPTAGALVDMTPDTGTFNGTATGLTTSPTASCKWSKQGNQVMLQVGSVTGSSNTASFSIGQLPAEITPATQQNLGVPQSNAVENNTASAASAGVLVNTNGSLTFYIAGNTAGFTNSGTKGVNAAFTICYPLN